MVKFRWMGLELSPTGLSPRALAESRTALLLGTAVPSRIDPRWRFATRRRGSTARFTFGDRRGSSWSRSPMRRRASAATFW